MMRLRAFLVALLATAMLGGGLVAPASADTVSPNSASALRFLSYNICGANEEAENKTPCGPYRDGVKVRVDELMTQIEAWDPDFIFLQEVCESQFNALKSALAAKGHAYAGSFAVMITPGQDGTGDLCKSDLEPEYNRQYNMGNAVLAKGTDKQVTELPDIELNVGGESPAQTWRSACVEAPLQGRKTRACSVHLNSYTIDIQTRQAEKLANAVNEWIDGGTPVVLGGDFNAQHKVNGSINYALTPLSASLNPFYSHSGGTGRFIETDETDAQRFTAQCQALAPPAGHCRSGAYTVLKPLVPTESKYDYIFVSKDHFKNVVADARPRASISDHYPYRGAATWSHCNNAADGKADLLRRGADGSLYRHFGGHSQVMLYALYCKVGAGWNADWSSMRHLARAGDVDGDGAEDLYAIDKTGSLRLYPGDKTETFFRWPRSLTASEAWPNAVDQMTVSPDMNGDGSRDMVVRIQDGTLTRISILPDGSTGNSVDIPAPGTESWSDYNKILAPGDITGDGTPDLLARTPAGDLYLYETGPNDTFKPRLRIGWSWNQYDDFTAPGDVNGDGKPDLLARDTTGSMWFYAGLGALSGTSAFAARLQSGYGYPPGETLF
ncbi:FG-GAP-like repeat-containing protein [Streptomyces sp. NPDC058084]|uniref:FG-GAP-like repeat-containing protein n=1 Tax=Streptomyces sp. NPDC058084 TaxID=3346333 RepID=UPI0036EEB7C9